MTTHNVLMTRMPLMDDMLPAEARVARIFSPLRRTEKQRSQSSAGEAAENKEDDDEEEPHEEDVQLKIKHKVLPREQHDEDCLKMFLCLKTVQLKIEITQISSGFALVRPGFT